MSAGERRRVRAFGSWIAMAAALFSFWPGPTTASLAALHSGLLRIHPGYQLL